MDGGRERRSDKHAARIVLTKLTNEHPNSSQAKTAKRQLANIK